jgi:low affinity Fe/Cu permease
MKRHIIYVTMILLVFSGCNKITEKIDEKIKQEIDNSMLELRHKMDSLNAITIDSIKSKLDSLQKQSIKLK